MATTLMLLRRRRGPRYCVVADPPVPPKRAEAKPHPPVRYFAKVEMTQPPSMAVKVGPVEIAIPQRWEYGHGWDALVVIAVREADGSLHAFWQGSDIARYGRPIPDGHYPLAWVTVPYGANVVTNACISQPLTPTSHL